MKFRLDDGPLTLIRKQIILISFCLGQVYDLTLNSLVFIFKSAFYFPVT